MADRHTPTIGSVLETSLYVANLERSVDFYSRVLGLAVSSEPSERMRALGVSADQVLLLFKKGASAKPTVSPYGDIPSTDGDGTLHVAFSIRPADFEVWQDRLRESQVEIESLVTWPEGGRSIYFRDPDGHAIELKTSNWYGKEMSW